MTKYLPSWIYNLSAKAMLWLFLSTMVKS
ncbi:hypothetical protein DH86_00003821 [Scytalidium sp. 3C]|nr:hypothetical protein DH86_00003821 [Scytalidium sp. 3C]